MASKSQPKQHVIMVMLDTLMDKAFQRALKEEMLPALSYFMDHAQYFPDVVTPFPTMSVNVESTLLTGHYADQHRVPALAWFNKRENRIINYGTHVRELYKLGLSRSLYDGLYRLNNEHLNPNLTTIHEEIHQAGKTSASINTLMYRGSVQTELQIPKLLRFFVNIEKSIKTSAPYQFTYGRLKKIGPASKYSRLWNKYGFNNKFSTQEFSYLVTYGKIPDFSVVYLPDHDKNVHKRGPMDTKGIKEMDQQLQEILGAFPSWNEALENNIWILMGDNGQAKVGDNKEKALVDLHQLLRPYKITKLRKGVKPEDQIVLGINLRSSFVYSLNLEKLPLKLVAEKLKMDSRIDVIAWREEEWIHVASSEGSFQFTEKGEYTDPYNHSWTIKGDPSILDIKIQNNKILYDNYPDALKRLHSALHSHEGEFIVTSVKPGHEFIGESTPRHPGGASHGGFHKDDSLIPLMVTGTDTKPEYLRVVDLKEWIIRLIHKR
ncbi:putative AlkP superfamily pyrophosphatase or phosphodiesterase [Evansella vedderi]|uniref:AlkP superfamily pyrophosphatase or phosphodiesterase n=1 Tax=Evansella vedderi TaxID=38282 RepID=A0ABT9ZU53_9BACI|nr:alkaline phosphatase family protein [Evansella vedderi]MDQ0254777.1 putative AlkP superfamily pyrophosphatase or phosphodiesterase [Evansella vedderi]